MKSNWPIETLVIQGVDEVESPIGEIVSPVHVSTTFARTPDGNLPSSHGYSRPDNPTYRQPQAILAALEGGSECFLFSSGMAAATAVFQALLPGDHVIAPPVMYFALRKWLGDFAASWGLKVEHVDTADLDALRAAIRPGRTRLVWLETPANPSWEVSDIAAVVEIAHTAHARVAVDNTVPTPVLTRPIELGADLVVHSASKYLNGHSDVLAGAVITARQDALWNRIRSWREGAGAVMGSFEAWLLLRGMRTLPLRVRQSCENALKIAQHFESDPRLEAVLYPGLASHPGHEIARAQMQGGFGGMLSFLVQGTDENAIAVAGRLSLFKRATSLGGVESLIEHRATIEGPSSPVPPNLLRISVGLEHSDDLIADLDQALEGTAVQTARTAPSSRTQTQTGADPASLATRVTRLLHSRVAPVVSSRGGELSVLDVSDGVACIAYSGSPGAFLPMQQQIERLVLDEVDAVTAVRFVPDPGGTVAQDDSTEAGDGANVARILQELINPAVAAHGGQVRLVGVDADTVRIKLDGRCQGCGLAEVTVRQGIERVLRERLHDRIHVLDETDHSAGSNPYYRPYK